MLLLIFKIALVHRRPNDRWSGLSGQFAAKLKSASIIIRVSAVAQGKLLEYAAEALRDNEFGLHLAEQATGAIRRLIEEDKFPRARPPTCCAGRWRS